MFLQISTTHQPATDLGYLLGKHPERIQTKTLSFGEAHVFYPEASEERCTAALLLEIDPVALTRTKAKNYATSFQLGQYVNDRPYSASSFLSTAIAKVFGSALNGNCSQKPDLTKQVLPLEATIAAVPASGGEKMIRQFFEPLGYEVQLSTQALDAQFPEWGESPYFIVALKHQLTLQELLTHLYILIPALDNNKHYFVGNPEVEKLMQKAHTWLEGHPAVQQIIRRYLKHQKSLTNLALDQLMNNMEVITPDGNNQEAQIEEKISLHQLRHQQVLEALKKQDVNSVLDLGCGSGKFLKLLLRESSFSRLTGMDVSYRALEIAKRRLHWDTLSPSAKDRIQLLQGALTYKDDRLNGYDAAVAIEVIEHLELNGLPAFEQAVFKYAKPKTVIITTPNVEYNVLFENLKAGNFRHSDHRFEWTRQEFQNWAKEVAQTYHYEVQFSGIGPVDDQHGCPSQMAVFTYQMNFLTT